jgi:beta-phosphoglucomutase
MNKGRFIEFIGLLSGLITIAIAIYTYVLSPTFLAWLQKPLPLRAWLLVLILAVVSILLIIVGRLLTTRQNMGYIPSDARSIMNFVIKNKLLERSIKIDAYLYTAETLLIPLRALLENLSKPIKIRMLLRRPEADIKKHRIAEGSLDTALEICRRNPNIDINIRFYEHEPLLRFQSYIELNNMTFLFGIYRWDSQHPMRYIGAEENAMLILKSNHKNSKIIIDSFYSRFEKEWNESSSLRAVIFDLDGVLLNTMNYHYLSWYDALSSRFTITDEDDFRKEIYFLEGLNAQETVKKLCLKYSRGIPDDSEINTIVSKKIQTYNNLLNKKYNFNDRQSSRNLSFDGVFNLLDYLKSCQVPLALVSGSNRETVTKYISYLFPDYFNVIVTGSDVERGKPDPMPFNKAAELLKIGNKNQCLVIENSPLGVQAAKSAEIPVFSILIDSPLDAHQLKTAGASQIFSSHEDLLKEIRSLRFGVRSH